MGVSRGRRCLGMISPAPTLVFVVGPGAVGKMTVGTELAARTAMKLFHNHHTIDLVLRFFPFGSPPFNRLVGEFRRRIIEEVAASDLPGLIFKQSCFSIPPLFSFLPPLLPPPLPAPSVRPVLRRHVLR